jgi:hypothetical protein
MEAIVRNPDTLGGNPVFRGTRVPIQTLFDYLEGGGTLQDFLEGFPTVARANRPSLHSKKQNISCSNAPECALVRRMY